MKKNMPHKYILTYWIQIVTIVVKWFLSPIFYTIMVRIVQVIVTPIFTSHTPDIAAYTHLSDAQVYLASTIMAMAFSYTY